MWPFKKKSPKPKKHTFTMVGETADKFAVLYDAHRNRTGSSYTEGRAMWAFIFSVLPDEKKKVPPPCTHEIVWKHVTPSIVTTETIK